MSGEGANADWRCPTGEQSAGGRRRRREQTEAGDVGGESKTQIGDVGGVEQKSVFEYQQAGLTRLARASCWTINMRA